MKHISTIVNVALAVVLILILLTIGLPNFNVHAAPPTPELQPAEAAVDACNHDRTIQVSGTAVVNVLPDRALIQLGVESNGRSPKEVQGRNAATISKIIRVIEKMGVEAKDISTDRYIIQPVYQPYDSLYIDGYRIYNVVSITMRDVDKTSEVIAAAFQAGANQVVDVQFYTSELRKYRDQAREMAMTAAREKATALSQAAGADTGCVLNITENSWSYYSGRNWWYGGNNQNIMTQNAVQNAASSGSEPALGDDSPVSAGKISIRAEVSATFALK